MQFARRLRQGIRDGRITTSYRLWHRPRVTTGGRYAIEGGHVVIDSVQEIAPDALTDALAIEAGFDTLDDMLGVARHGTSETLYRVTFHFVAT